MNPLTSLSCAIKRLDTRFPLFSEFVAIWNNLQTLWLGYIHTEDWERQISSPEVVAVCTTPPDTKSSLNLADATSLGSGNGGVLRLRQESAFTVLQERSWGENVTNDTACQTIPPVCCHAVFTAKSHHFLSLPRLLRFPIIWHKSLQIRQKYGMNWPVHRVCMCVT